MFYPGMTIHPVRASSRDGIIPRKNHVNSNKEMNRPRRTHTEGDIRVYGDAALDNSSCGISVILVLTCGIAVLSRSLVCRF